MSSPLVEILWVLILEARVDISVMVYLSVWTVTVQKSDLFNDKYIVNHLAMGLPLSNCLKQSCMKTRNSQFSQITVNGASEFSLSNTVLISLFFFFFNTYQRSMLIKILNPYCKQLGPL